MTLCFRNSPGCNCDPEDCTCPTTCEVRDQATLELIGYIHGHELTISGIPASIGMIGPDGIDVTITGMDALNGVHLIPPEPTLDTDGNFYGCFGKVPSAFDLSNLRGLIASVPITATSTDTRVDCDGFTHDSFARLSTFVGTQPDGVPKASFLLDIPASSISSGGLNCGCRGLAPERATIIRVEQFPLLDPRKVFYSTAADAYRDYREGEYILDGWAPCTRGIDDPGRSLTFNLRPIIQATDAVPHIGWTYTISGIPDSFFVRATNSTLAYEVIGLDIMNGDYERLIDDTENCDIGSIAFVEFDIQVREYNISTSSPCTILPVGSAVDATARLFLPTTPTDTVISIQLTPSLSKTILIRDADTFSCDGYETDGYVSETNDECLSQPDPIVELSSRPLMGTGEE